VAPSAAEATALDDLTAFLDEARAADARLRAAATLVSATVGDTAVVVDAVTAAAVTAAEPTTVAAAIPSGMQDPLLLPVLTAYSGLVSRWAAMARYATAATIPRDPSVPNDWGEETVACLGNGSAAARGFEADHEAVVAAASLYQPLRPVAPDSLAAAELQERISEIRLRNVGCESCGGYLATALSSIAWDPAGDPTTRTGTSSLPGEEGPGVGFTATYTPDDGWTIRINAC